LGAGDLPLLTTSASRFSPFGPLAIAAPGRDLSIAAAHVDDSIEIRAMPYQAILGEFLGLRLGSWMRRAAGQSVFFIVVDSKSHMANMPRRTFVRYAFSLIAPMPKSTAPKRRRSPPKISALEKAAVCIMRKLYAATGGQPQRWESLGNLGAVKADAAGIAYAIERDWLVISGGLHSAA
jgi:hypothetical protein